MLHASRQQRAPPRPVLGVYPRTFTCMYLGENRTQLTSRGAHNQTVCCPSARVGSHLWPSHHRYASIHRSRGSAVAEYIGIATRDQPPVAKYTSIAVGRATSCNRVCLRPAWRV